MLKHRRHVFVEANPFASRLHVLAALLRGASPATESGVELVYRARVSEPHWREWLGQIPQSVTVNPVRHHRTKMNHPGKAGIGALFRLLKVAYRRTAPGDTVTLTALDDYLVAALVLAPLLGAMRMAGRRFIVIKYRVDELFARQLRARPLVVWAASWIVIRVSGAHFVVFDERHESGRVTILPDPWQGEFSGLSKSDAREHVQLDATLPAVGLIGYQDERKGFPTAAAALVRLHEQGWNGQCLILGRVDARYDDYLETLRILYGDKLIHQPSFVTDADLPFYFRACDVIWLPYFEKFTSTSGVLARAAAARVPVVASSGGLVAHRVRTHHLGTVVPSTDPVRLAAATLRELSGRGDFRDESAAGWAASCHVSQTERAVQALYAAV